MRVGVFVGVSVEVGEGVGVAVAGAVGLGVEVGGTVGAEVEVVGGGIVRVGTTAAWAVVLFSMGETATPAHPVNGAKKTRLRANFNEIKIRNMIFAASNYLGKSKKIINHY